MAIDDLPLPVVNFLNVIGVPWPYVDEDTVVRFADLTREFARAVENTHADATRAISAIAEAHQGDRVSVDPGAVQAQLAVLRDHATAMREHGTRYAGAVNGLGF